MTTVFHAWSYGRFTEIQSNLKRKKRYRKNRCFNFLGGSFSNRDNVRAPNILKDCFPSSTDPSIFISIAPVLLNGQTKLVEFLQH